jgi:hypothetical protein
LAEGDEAAGTEAVVVRSITWAREHTVTLIAPPRSLHDLSPSPLDDWGRFRLPTAVAAIYSLESDAEILAGLGNGIVMDAQEPAQPFRS